MTAPRPEPADGVRAAAGDGRHFAPSLLYAAAKMYYDEDATQAEVAAKLHTSRATVSRLLSEARRQGVVRIQVIPPDHQGTDDLAASVAAALQLRKVHISAPLSAPAGRSTEDVMGSVLAPAVGRALQEVGLHPGDVLLVSSGRTVYEVSRFDLPQLPGVIVAPTVGGTDQPEGWYQTNEITRRIAERIGGRATYLFAPALPGADLFPILQQDPAIQRVLHLWPHARCVLTGIGAPPLLRHRAPQFVDLGSSALVEAVGDICSRFYSRSGEPVPFPGSERLIAVDLETLRSLPVVIAVAAGLDKVAPVIAGARAGFFTELVTEPRTAEAILARS
jgi:DNA-binding transcriptional regulator LsrR (DeoR family)